MNNSLVDNYYIILHIYNEVRLSIHHSYIIYAVKVDVSRVLNYDF